MLSRDGLAEPTDPFDGVARRVAHVVVPLPYRRGFGYGDRMADERTVVYLPGQEGRRRVRSWRLRVDGGCDRVVTTGTLPGDRWWMAVSWEYPTGYGHVYSNEKDVMDDAEALRGAYPGSWQEVSVAAAIRRRRS